jgi:hypothetical protein
MNTILRKILMFLTVLLMISCLDKETGNKAFLKEELPMIETTIRASIAWAKNKDFGLLYSVIANDSNYLEVGPTAKITRGFDQFKKNEVFWGSPGFKAVGYEIRDLSINVSQTGDVAWYYCVLDDMNEWMGKPASWMNTRWTGVLEKRKGRWVIVQMHFSFAKEQEAT